jgi:hypothetical protein
MKTTVTRNDFVDAFRRIRPDNFTPDALRALFDYFEEMESSTGEEMELDVIAICCEWSEFKTATEAAIEYGWEAPEIEEGSERDDTSERDALEFLMDNTQVVEFSGGVVVMGF